LWQGEPAVVIGTRRAFFLPWTNIRDIFIIDEADPLHKSWDMAPRFHNRDLAKSLATLHQATLHLVGHTPSIETYYSIKKKTPLILPTFSRTDTIKLVNLKEERKAQNYEIISDQVKKNILQIDHEKNESIFLFSHHRGNSSYVACKECGQVNLCPLCFTPLTYHQKLKLLQCHECNFKEPFPAPCKICGGFEIKLSKNGTEALEEEVRKIGLKNMGVLRIDKDTDTPKIFTTNPTLIIGTQQAWRKINWNTLKLMVFTDADIPLFIPEHKSSEQLWYYLRDASFRLSKHATLLIQTAQPKQAVFNEISNPQNYYEQELTNRKDFGYPPFSYLVKLYTGCLSKQEISAEAQKIYQKLAMLTKKTFLSTIVSSPRPSIPEIHQKKYWQIISIKIPPFSYKKTLQKLLEVVPSTWKIDLNPQNILRF
jgi:primosomal protein N' (replication factor Y)